MKAIGFHEYGDAGVVQMLTMEQPQPAANQLLVRVIAAAVNPADNNIREGRFKLLLRVKMPFVMGSDVAGVVEAVGADVIGFKPGDRVFAMQPVAKGGAFAEYAVVDAAHAAHIPQTLSFEEAAAVPLTGLTALQALEGRIKPGQQVMIYGASGGVGTFGLQLAKSMGAEVTAVTSSRNIDLVRGLCADHVLDYTSRDIVSLDQQFDVVFDAVGLYPYKHWKKHVRPGGVCITVNPGHGNPLTKGYVNLTQKQKLASVFVQPSGNDLRKLADLLQRGQIRAVVDRTYPMEQASEALNYVETKRASGKIVIQI